MFFFMILFFLVNPIDAADRLASDQKTLQRALNQSRPGDAIIMADRDWMNLRLKITRSGNEGRGRAVWEDGEGKTLMVWLE